MQLKGPTTLVQNTDAGQWLVQMKDFIGGPDGLERIEISVLMPRSNDELAVLHAKVIDRAIAMLQDYRKHLPRE